jgi:4-amino-4-deoxy-L-arabinose transferase-like glycosyltransferase
MTRPVWVAVVFLLALYAVLALAASRHKGLSFDEGEQLAVGYDIWLRHDFRMEGANGDLVKRWATLPFLISKPGFVATSDPAWRRGEPYVLGYRFFFGCGNREETLLLEGRAMMVLLGAATGLLVFFCSRSIFGNTGGLISLGLFASSPHMLAFGAIVSTEMTVCLALLGSTWSIWRLLHRVTWGRLIGSLVFFGLLVLSKLTALVILPVAAILIGVQMLAGGRWTWELGTRRLITSQAARAATIGGLVFLHALFGWGSIWAAYGFRYAASPNPADPTITFREPPYRFPADPVAAAIVSYSRNTHLLPQGFLRGVNWLLTAEPDEREAFMGGQWSGIGWRRFFPYAMWVKSTPTLPLLLLLGLGSLYRRFRRARRAPPGDAAPAASHNSPFYEAIPYCTLIAVYFQIAILQNMDIGFRHILPIYPAFDVLAGSAALICGGARWCRGAVAAVLLWRAAGSLAVYPDFLAYFSPLVGGPAQGYKHLVDSSLDWGMDLPGLKHWLDRNNPGNREPVYLAYFGTDSPDYYGIKCHRLPGFFDWRRKEAYALNPGIYAISATLLQSVYTRPFGPWNQFDERRYQICLKEFEQYDRTANDPAARAALIQSRPPGFWERRYELYERLRFGRLCAWLRHRSPAPKNVGYSILIWRLDRYELDDALLGPPAEPENRPTARPNNAASF